MSLGERRSPRVTLGALRRGFLCLVRELLPGALHAQRRTAPHWHSGYAIQQIPRRHSSTLAREWAGSPLAARRRGRRHSTRIRFLLSRRACTSCMWLLVAPGSEEHLVWRAPCVLPLQDAPLAGEGSSRGRRPPAEPDAEGHTFPAPIYPPGSSVGMSGGRVQLGCPYRQAS